MNEFVDETTRLDQLRQGHEPAFRWFVDTYQQRVFRTALAIVQTPEDAEDIAQEVFLEVFQTIGAFRGEATLATWLYRLTTSRALRRERDRKRKKRFGFMTSLFGSESDDGPAYDPPDRQTPETMLEADEQTQYISRAVASLAESQKVAFTLHYQEELSYQEIAAVHANIGIGSGVAAVSGAADASQKTNKTMNDSPNQTNHSDRWEADFRKWGQRPQPELRPFFYTRLEARLRARLDQTVESATWLPFWLRRPAYAYSVLSLLVLLNIGVVVSLSENAATSNDDQTTVSSVIQDEYSIDSYITAYE